MKNIDKTYYDFVRKHPIEKIVQSLYFNALGMISPEPCVKNKDLLLVVKQHADIALKKIFLEDAKYRPSSEWVAAVDIVEQIRDDVNELVADLERIFYK